MRSNKGFILHLEMSVMVGYFQDETERAFSGARLGVQVLIERYRKAKIRDGLQLKSCHSNTPLHSVQFLHLGRWGRGGGDLFGTI